VDIITFHVPASEQSMGMLGSHNFNKCRKGVLIVNAARGGIVSEDGLLEALESGQCGGAALDVYTSEPPEETSKLRNHPKVLTTPHLGASTREAQQAVGISAASQALAYLRGEGIRGAVNAGGLRVDLDPIQTVFVDLADRMSRLISPMVTRGITTVTIEMHGKQLFPAAGTIERTALVGLLSSHLNVPLNVINVSKVAEERGINIRIVTEEEKITGPQLSIEIAGPSGSVDGETHPADQTRRIVGRVYDDLRPRVIEVNGYHMDMVPAGHMLVAQNDDRPGMIGIVGTIMGKAGVNIADMAISRRGDTALMVLKIDNAPEPGSIDQLTENDGIRKVAVVKLPAE
jgi:D-3-phosphoglycerate dehydrogenase